MRKRLTLFFVAIFFGSFLVVPLVQADSCLSKRNFLVAPSWYEEVCKSNTNEVEIKDPAKDISRIALNVFSIFLYVISYAAVAMVIWGGIKYLSTGDPAKASAARQTIQNALIGLLLALSSIAIVNFVTGNIPGAS